MIHLQAKGKGTLIAVIGCMAFAVVFITCNLILDYLKLTMPEIFYRALAGVALLLAALVSRIALDKEDTPGNFSSSFMYVPVMYWPHLYALVGLLIILDQVITYYKIF